MKVLYIVGGEGNRYGSEIIAIDLISAGKRNGIEYVVVTANKGAVSEACDQLGIENYVVPFRFFVYKAMSNPILNFIKKTVWKTRAEYLTRRAVRVLEKKLDMKSFDLIHTNLSRDLLGGVLAERNGIPHIWHIHELYKAHYQLSFLRENQVKWMAEHADRFIAISKTVADEWIESGLPREKVKIVYNGIDLSKIERKCGTLDSNLLRLVMVGHIVPPKGQEQVIIGLSKLPQEIRAHVLFDCYGEGTEDYKEKLQQESKDLGVNLSLKGYCSEIGSVLKEYDVGVNYSRGEGFGLSTVEYMAAGICPVVANTGANEELIENGRNGFVFDYGNVNAFAEMVNQLFFNRELLNAMSRAASEDAVSKYSLLEMEKAAFSVYEKTLNTKNRGIL